MANVRAVAGWLRESEAEAAIDLPLPPGVDASTLANLCEPEIRLSPNGLRLYADGGPCEVRIEPGAFEAVARLAKLRGMRPEQYIEQLIKRHVRSRAAVLDEFE